VLSSIWRSSLTAVMPYGSRRDGPRIAKTGAKFVPRFPLVWCSCKRYKQRVRRGRLPSRGAAIVSPPKELRALCLHIDLRDGSQRSGSMTGSPASTRRLGYRTRRGPFYPLFHFSHSTSCCARPFRLSPLPLRIPCPWSNPFADAVLCDWFL
jgi:hypothetical protein